jgi:hypothetical protein
MAREIHMGGSSGVVMGQLLALKSIAALTAMSPIVLKVRRWYSH